MQRRLCLTLLTSTPLCSPPPHCTACPDAGAPALAQPCRRPARLAHLAALPASRRGRRSRAASSPQHRTGVARSCPPGPAAAASSTGPARRPRRWVGRPRCNACHARLVAPPWPPHCILRPHPCNPKGLQHSPKQAQLLFFHASRLPATVSANLATQQIARSLTHTHTRTQNTHMFPHRSTCIASFRPKPRLTCSSWC